MEFLEWAREQGYVEGKGHKVRCLRDRRVFSVAVEHQRRPENVFPDDFYVDRQLSQTSLYAIWFDLWSRCHSYAHKSYPIVGAVGSKLVTEWYDFNAFESWLQPILERSNLVGKEADIEIARRSISKDYGPDNCFVVVIPRGRG